VKNVKYRSPSIKAADWPDILMIWDNGGTADGTAYDPSDDEAIEYLRMYCRDCLDMSPASADEEADAWFEQNETDGRWRRCEREADGLYHSLDGNKYDPDNMVYLEGTYTL